DKTFWPAWLARDIPGLAAWTLAYDAPPTNWFGTSMALQDRARNVLERLLGQPELRDRPLVFVCHSLGGLAVRQVLRPPDGRRAHSELALVKNTAGLRDLNVWYRNWSGVLHHKVFYEKRGTTAGIIVPDDSADPGLLHVDPIAIDADHVDICKPA